MLYARLLIVVAALASAGGCAKPAEINVTNAYVRLGTAPRAPAAAYFTLRGGAKDATLIAAGTSVAIRSEMHQSMKHHGMASMKPLGQVALPAETTVEFAPGGRHVMLFDVNPGIKPGRRMPFLLTFADGSRVKFNATAIAAADPAPQR